MKFWTQFFSYSQDLLDTENNGGAALEYSTEQSDLTSADISDSDTGKLFFSSFSENKT